MLETLLHGDNSFVTLTYADAPETLNPKHAQDWLKRLRKAHEPLRLRYYLVGEYGDQTQRPHYHAALFGYPSCDYGLSRYKTRKNCCPPCDLVRDTWGLGHVYLGQLETSSAQYIAGYVTKKMTNNNDPRLNGRHPEFARMSLRPGLGVDALHEVAHTLMQFNLDVTQADVPSALRHGKRLLPLGRFLRRKLRTMIGKEPNAPPETLAEIQAQVQPLWDAAVAATPQGGLVRDAIFKNSLIDADEGAMTNLEAKHKLKRNRSL